MPENESMIMKPEEYFNSLIKPVPPVRRDIQMIPVQTNGDFYFYFYDALKYTNPEFALNRQVEPVLSLINGRLNIGQIQEMLGGGIEKNDLLKFIQMLDQEMLLETDRFKNYSRSVEEQYEKQSVRQPVLAGSSYPAEREEQFKYVKKLLGSGNPATDYQPQKALFAPHIDTDIGGSSYGIAFSAIKSIAPKRVVILATSHYSGYYPELYANKPFIGSRKTHLSASGNLKVDDAYLDHLLEKSDSIGYTEQDRAHRTEHSIELHLLFANHIWNHDFKIVPILIGSFEELFYKKDGALHNYINNFSDLIASLDDPDTFYLISGDLSHIGMKFGDNRPAANMRNRVSVFDKAFLELASKNRSEDLLEHVGTGYDPFRVCGFPPILTFLKMFPDASGKILEYQWWDESDRHSAVSYGVIGY